MAQSCDHLWHHRVTSCLSYCWSSADPNYWLLFSVFSSPMNLFPASTCWSLSEWSSWFLASWAAAAPSKKTAACCWLWGSSPPTNLYHTYIDLWYHMFPFVRDISKQFTSTHTTLLFCTPSVLRQSPSHLHPPAGGGHTGSCGRDEGKIRRPHVTSSDLGFS